MYSVTDIIGYWFSLRTEHDIFGVTRLSSLSSTAHAWLSAQNLHNHVQRSVDGS